MAFFLYILGTLPIFGTIYILHKSIKEDLEELQNMSVESSRISSIDKILSKNNSAVSKIEARLASIEEKVIYLETKKKGGRPRKIK